MGLQKVVNVLRQPRAAGPIWSPRSASLSAFCTSKRCFQIHPKFETDKEKLRKIIRKALDKAGSFDEFSSLLLQQGVIVKESRGRYSYLTPDRTKPITARKLGDDFDKTAVLAALERNALRPVNIVTKRDATRCRRICPRPDTAPAEHTE